MYQRKSLNALRLLIFRCASACLSIYQDTMPYGGYFKYTFLQLLKKLGELFNLIEDIPMC